MSKEKKLFSLVSLVVLSVGLLAKLTPTGKPQDIRAQTPTEVDRCGNGICDEGEVDWCPPDGMGPCTVGSCPGDCGGAYYVRPEGGSYGSEDGNSYDNAWGGFDDIVWDSFNPHDTLYICGHHSEKFEVNKSFFDDIPFTISGDCTEPGIINAGDGPREAFLVQQKSNLTVRDLEIMGGDTYIVRFRSGGSNNALINSHIHNSTNGGGVGISSDDTLIKDIIVHDVGWDAIHVGSTTQVTDVEIDNGTLYDFDNLLCCGDGVYIGLGAINTHVHDTKIIKDTLFKNSIVNAGDNTLIEDNEITFVKHGIQVTAGTDVTIRNNLLEGIPEGDNPNNAFIIQGSLGFSDVSVYYNVVEGAKRGIHFADNSVGRVYNNVFNVSEYGLVAQENSSIISRNNIFLLKDNSVYSVYARQTHSNDYLGTNNIYYPSTKIKWKGVEYDNISGLIDLGFETDSYEVDPLVNPDYTLQSLSPAIDAGIDVGLTRDFGKNPIIGNPDIGAWEYDSGTITPVPTATNTPVPAATNTPEPSIPGDINSDGVVSILDYILLSNAFGTRDVDADINQDGIVSILDYIILSNNFGRTSG